VSRETRISFPDHVRSALLLRANLEGFYGPSALSSYFRHVIIEHAGMDIPERVNGVLPIVIQPTSVEERQWFVDYSRLKHHASVEAWALSACGGMTKKVPLTEDEKAAYDRMVGLRAASQKR
jgi:hypothetical protein